MTWFHEEPHFMRQQRPREQKDISSRNKRVFSVTAISGTSPDA